VGVFSHVRRTGAARLDIGADDFFDIFRDILLRPVPRLPPPRTMDP
jgi:hypothetical protein